MMATRVKGGQTYGDERRLDRGDKPTMQNTGDVLQNCALETYIILLINVPPVNSI